MTLRGVKDIKITAKVHIARPLPEVYRAVVEPERLNEYFTTSATPLQIGEVAHWTWGNGEKSKIHVKELDQNRKVAFEWDAHKCDYKTSVDMTFERAADGRTVVTVTEKGWHSDPSGIASATEHRGTWEHMLMCMKAWLVHKIDLRK